MNYAAPLGFEIREQSRTPKYKQLVSEINNKIEKGLLCFGQKLPSINNLSEDCLLSRNTVEKAYIRLKNEGVIEAVRGKGYFVKNTRPISKLKVMLLFNKLSDYKLIIYDSITRSLHNIAEVDLYDYHSDFTLFCKTLIEHGEDYHYFIVIPHFIDEDARNVKEVLSSISKKKLIVLDRKLEYFNDFFGNVYQDFKMDIYNTLAAHKDLIGKYRKITLAFPEQRQFAYQADILNGFKRFCGLHGIAFEVVDQIGCSFRPEKNEGVITMADADLIAIIKKVKAANLELNRDYGVISYNENPLKEVLANGITVLTTDFVEMGRIAAQMIKEKKGKDIKNTFTLIERASW